MKNLKTSAILWTVATGFWILTLLFSQFSTQQPALYVTILEAACILASAAAAVLSWKRYAKEGTRPQEPEKEESSEE